MNLHKNRVQSPKECFTPPTWPPFLCLLLQYGRRDVIWTDSIKSQKKYLGKLECLLYEMQWIKSKGPKLNTQADSIRAKLFTWVNAFMLIYFLTSNIYKCTCFPLFLISSFDNDDKKSSKRHVVLLSLILFSRRSNDRIYWRSLCNKTKW